MILLLGIVDAVVMGVIVGCWLAKRVKVPVVDRSEQLEAECLARLAAMQNGFRG